LACLTPAADILYHCLVLFHRFYVFDGSGMVRNPALSVTGLTNPKALAIKESGEVSVLEGTEVKHYQFNGSGI